MTTNNITEKALQIIASCQTPAQLLSAQNYLMQLEKHYSDADLHCLYDALKKRESELKVPEFANQRFPVGDAINNEE
jgi:hypothetical protein